MNDFHKYAPMSVCLQTDEGGAERMPVGAFYGALVVCGFLGLLGVVIKAVRLLYKRKDMHLGEILGCLPSQRGSTAPEHPPDLVAADQIQRTKSRRRRKGRRIGAEDEGEDEGYGFGEALQEENAVLQAAHVHACMAVPAQLWCCPRHLP